MNFKDFWTNENNILLPEKSYMYSFKHIITIIIVLGLAITLSFVFRNKSDRAKKILLNILVGILAFFEVLSRIVNLIVLKTYTFESVSKVLLPLEVCSVLAITLIVANFTKFKSLKNFASICGIFASVAFMIYPTVGFNYKYLSFTCLYSIISHSLGFICSVLLITLGYNKFIIKDIWKTYVYFIVMFLWGVIVDFIMFPGSNYMYLIKDPLQLNLKFPYQIIYGILIVLYVLIFYLIPYIYIRIKNKKSS